jgi:signal transduction histidine kinase
VFADMFGFSSPAEVVGVDISRIYREPKVYDEFRNLILYGTEDVIHHQLEVQTLSGSRSFFIEVSTKLQRDPQGRPTGRIGVVRDLSRDQPLKQLRQDLGNVLHTFTTGLIAIESDMDAALQALGPTPLPKATRTSLERLHAEMHEPVANLRRSLTALLKALTERSHATLYQEFSELQITLDEAEKEREIFRAHRLYATARQITDASQDTLSNHLAPRQPLKQVRQDASEVMRVFARTRLQERIADILSMDHALRSLRAYVTTPSLEVQSPRTTFILWTLVEQAMGNLHDFASRRGVRFRPSPTPSQSFILANEQEIMRAVANLLHNAVKYSWSRDSGTWVGVNLYQMDHMLTLEIENYGVPIPADEIESGLIYLFGYRSRLSTDRGRVGTGIGLADAVEIVKRHGGTIKLRSRPASPGGQAERLDPFLTTAILTLPTTE